MNELLKYVLIVFLFYFLALFQFGFLNSFTFFGISLDLFFIVFFSFTFFGIKNSNFQQIFVAIVAGFFLDIFFSFYFGVFMVAFLLINTIVKQAFGLLKTTKDNYPLIYFVPIFVVCFIFYRLAGQVSFYYLGKINQFTFTIIWQAIYNLVFAVAGFFVYKAVNYFYGKRI